MALFALREARRFDWILQGFGMLRLHLDRDTRLHVWDSRYAAPGVSTIHDHLQWGLQSTVIFGELTNYRFVESDLGQIHRQARITAGIGGGIREELAPIRLLRQAPEIYRPGDTYAQAPNEIHESRPRDGTVTLMLKTPTEDKDGARVFWRSGEWVTAEPRAADIDEVLAITRAALRRAI
jgi:hypothetical protein